MSQKPQKQLMMLHNSKRVLSAHSHLQDCSNDGTSDLSVLSGQDREQGQEGEREGKREDKGAR